MLCAVSPGASSSAKQCRVRGVMRGYALDSVSPMLQGAHPRPSWQFDSRPDIWGRAVRISASGPSTSALASISRSRAGYKAAKSAFWLDSYPVEISKGVGERVD